MTGADGPERVDRRTLRYRHRRGELLEAVLRYVLEHGISDLSLRPLAAAVGVSHVTLRHHFGTKEELVAEVFAAIRRSQPLPEMPLPEGGADQLLRALWDRWTTQDGSSLFRLLFEAYGLALRSPDRYRTFLDHVVDDWLGIIAGYVTHLGCPPAEAPAYATFVLAQVRGLQLDFLATGDRERVDASVEILLGFLREQAVRWREP